MKKIVLAMLVGIWALSTVAQQLPLPRHRLDPVRIPIRHADPWYVLAMIQGTPVISPELSTILGFAGLPQGMAGAGNSLFSGGRFNVNPTDNSLWFYPDR